jgi:hypothetical protein
MDYNKDMKDKTYDLAFLRNGLDELESYLLSDELFWPMTGHPPGQSTSFFKLTLGNLLLSMQRLSAYALTGSFTPQENAEYTKLRTLVDTIQQKWQVSWQKKADQEFPSRFKQWVNVLNEIKNDRYNNAAYYANDVRTRVLLDLLTPYSTESQGYDLSPLDAALRNMLKPAPFLWGEALEPGFPEKTYWYLYGKIKLKE